MLGTNNENWNNINNSLLRGGERGFCDDPEYKEIQKAYPGERLNLARVIEYYQSKGLL